MGISYTPGTISLTPPTGTVSNPTFGSISPGLAEELIASALVDLNETGIVTDGSGYVTEWTNSGTGGAAYDLDVVVGTLANSSVTTLNGHNAVNSTGSYALESTAGQTINYPYTLVIVCRFSNAAPSGDQNMTDARSNAGARSIIFTYDADSDRFAFYAGTNLLLPGAYDTNPHAIIVNMRGDTTTSITGSELGTNTGSAGAQNFDYSTLFANLAGANSSPGYVARYQIFPRSLTAIESAAIMAYLRGYYAI